MKKTKLTNLKFRLTYIYRLLYQGLTYPSPETLKLSLVTEKSEADLRDLAVGRWVNYKMVVNPAFILGLNPDAEYILSRLCLDQLTKSYSKVGEAVQIGGTILLNRTNLMIEVCQDCITSGKTLEQKFKEMGLDN